MIDKIDKNNYTGQDREIFLALLEQERLEMLAAGMSEADIFYMHFGEYDEKGELREDKYSGDYAFWLLERAEVRSDHKYSYGTPQSFEELKYEGGYFRDHSADDCLLSVEQTIDIEAVLQTLTAKQQVLVRALFYDGATSAEYAQDNSLDKSTVSRNLEVIRRKVKRYF